MKRALFVTAAVMLSTTAAVGTLLAADLYLHSRFERAAGLNYRGYRGPVLGRKQPTERRIIMLGGSTTFGYGVSADRSIPAVLEQALRRQRGPDRPVSIANLAYNGEGAYSFRFTLRDYDYLEPDAVVMYTGYNDLCPADKTLGCPFNTNVYRHSSPVFRLTGYMPILPLVVREKMMSLRFGGDLNAAYRDEKPVFRPGASPEAAASLERDFGELSGHDAEAAAATTGGCGDPWGRYCAAVSAAIDDVVARGRHALVVTQPYLSDQHVEQQTALAGFLDQRFLRRDGARVHYVNLGHALDLHDASVAFDGMHLTEQGNARIAALLEPHMLRILEEVDGVRGQ